VKFCIEMVNYILYVFKYDSYFELFKKNSTYKQTSKQTNKEKQSFIVDDECLIIILIIYCTQICHWFLKYYSKSNSTCMQCSSGLHTSP